MKKTITLSLALVCSLFSFAQFAGYQVEIFQEEYNDLISATEVSDSSDQWDDPIYEMPIGFLTEILGYVTNTLSTAGAPGGALLNTSDYSGDEGAGGFLFYLADLIDQGASGGEYSPISYITEGEPGNQIFKLEFKNAGFYGDYIYPDTIASFINVQFWLYEADGSWESRIGPNLIVNPENLFEYNNGPIVGMVLFDTADQDVVYLVNDQVDPAVIDTISYGNDYLVGIQSPEENTVIRFSRVISSVSNSKTLTGISLFPTLSRSQIQVNIDNDEINLDELSIRIYDLTGRIFYENKSIESGQISVPVEHLTAGQYYLSVQSKKEHKTIPIVKI